MDGTAKASEISEVITRSLNSVKDLKLNRETEEDDNPPSGGSGAVRTSRSLKDPVYASVSQTALGMLFLVSLDDYLRTLFLKNGIAFPSALGGMVGLFSLLCAASAVAPEFTDKQLFYRLSHAGGLLKMWLPLFFVPPLVVLPLKAHLLTGLELQFTVLTIIGAFFSLFTTGTISSYLLNLFQSSSPVAADEVPEAAKSFKLPKARFPFTVSAVTAAAMILAPAARAFLIVPFSISSTVAGFLLGTKPPSEVKAAFHPVLTSAAYTSLALFAASFITAQPFFRMLSSYYGSGLGAGDRISTLLGPSIICFGLQLFQYRAMLFRNIQAVISSTFSAAVLGLVSSAVLSSALKLKTAQVFDSISSALSIALNEITASRFHWHR